MDKKAGCVKWILESEWYNHDIRKRFYLRLEKGIHSFWKITERDDDKVEATKRIIYDMSRGMGARANLRLQDEKTIIYEYGGYNLNEDNFKNEA